MGKVSLHSIVDAVNDLPSLPQISKRVIELTDDPNSTAYHINAVLSKDPSMTAKILRLANSAYYGFPRRIPTIAEATILLGFQTIRSMVMAASVNMLLSQKMEGYALSQGELWKHSQASAIAARLIAREIRFPNPELAYTAALLHDIGKVVLNSYMRELYHEVLERAETDQIPFLEAEDIVLGFNHAVVGSRVAEKWNLPVELIEAIAFHHHPDQSKHNHRLTALVHISDFICLTMGIGIGVDGLLYQVSTKALENLRISEDAIQIYISRLSDMFSDQDSFEF
ncbi:MAG TPA: HDOD domain-containing protein [Atribacteraceae bacterium]|nr:HDOD domain-containing protein [Atribacteraceae bacterium]